MSKTCTYCNFNPKNPNKHLWSKKKKLLWKMIDFICLRFFAETLANQCILQFTQLSDLVIIPDQYLVGNLRTTILKSMQPTFNVRFRKVCVSLSTLTLYNY